MTFHTVAVLMGGWSAEREVSLRSGAACARALESKGYHVLRIDADRSLPLTLAKTRADAVLNVLHGCPGEDGTVQGLLELMGMPYSHSGVLASALAMNKGQARTIMAAAGVPIAKGRVVSRHDAARAHVLPPPYVLKPVAEGSSVGVFIVREGEAPPAELADPDWAFGDMLVAEAYIAGLELTCAVMGDRALGVTEIEASQTFYDYTSKYAAGGSRHILPARIDDEVAREIERYALLAHNALGCRGVSRADFRYDPTTRTLACLEVNTQPGMTETSLVPELAAHAGISFPDLVEWMVKDASLAR